MGVGVGTPNRHVAQGLPPVLVSIRVPVNDPRAGPAAADTEAGGTQGVSSCPRGADGLGEEGTTSEQTAAAQSDEHCGYTLGEGTRTLRTDAGLRSEHCIHRGPETGKGFSEGLLFKLKEEQRTVR